MQRSVNYWKEAVNLPTPSPNEEFLFAQTLAEYSFSPFVITNGYTYSVGLDQQLNFYANTASSQRPLIFPFFYLGNDNEVNYVVIKNYVLALSTQPDTTEWRVDLRTLQLHSYIDGSEFFFGICPTNAGVFTITTQRLTGCYGVSWIAYGLTSVSLTTTNLVQNVDTSRSVDWRTRTSTGLPAITLSSSSLPLESTLSKGSSSSSSYFSAFSSVSSDYSTTISFSETFSDSSSISSSSSSHSSGTSDTSSITNIDLMVLKNEPKFQQNSATSRYFSR
ncbi:putative serine-rich protein, partial [Scheffersomyces stipitis CBS 6054]